MLLIPTAMVNASLDRLNKLKGTNAHLIDEFKIKDEFKGVLLGKVHYIVKDIERIIRKDSGVTKFTFMTSKIDDVVFNTKGMNTEVTFYISGVCTDG